MRDPKGDNFKGIIDEVCIYDKALTAQEAWRVFAKEQEPEEPIEPEGRSWAAYCTLPFNEGNGLTTADQSGNKNNEISGATWVKTNSGMPLALMAMIMWRLLIVLLAH